MDGEGCGAVRRSLRFRHVALMAAASGWLRGGGGLSPSPLARATAPQVATVAWAIGALRTPDPPLLAALG